MEHKTIFGTVKLRRALEIVDGPSGGQLRDSFFEHDLPHSVTFTLKDGRKPYGIVAAMEVDERVASSSRMLVSYILILQTSGGARGARVEYNTQEKKGLFWEIDPVYGPCL